jgi:AcrR family transcriptional regulator
MTTTAPKRRRDKAATEQALLDAALELQHRDGVLVGLNMQEIADRAGVSRGLIHHHFGSRRALLRAALARELEAGTPAHIRRPLEPQERIRRGFRQVVKNPDYSRMLALLLLDEDETLEPMPHLQERAEDNAREQREGIIEAEVDVETMVLVWDALMLGYSLLRERSAEQLGTTPATQDTRFLAMIERLLGSLRT